MTLGNVVDDHRIRSQARRFGVVRELPLVATAAGLAQVANAALPIGGEERRIRALLIACRRAAFGAARGVVSAAVRRTGVLERGEFIRERRIGWERYEEQDFDMRSPELTTSLVLKEPGANGEKGVLYCSFEYNWMRLLAHYDARRILSQYYLVGASSWSPTDFTALANFAGLSDDPLFIGISNVADVRAYEILAPTISPVPLLASDWVHPDFYPVDSGAARETDILMVANFSRFKRHWLLFEALRRMRRDLRVTLVGIAAPGRGEAELRREARAFGVRQDLRIVTGASIDAVTREQLQAKTALIFSRREGSCVATAESLFAGTPVGMMRDAHIGSLRYINAQTGRLFTRAGLSGALERFVEESPGFQPRAWADAHITCWQSSAALNALLRAHSERTGRPWTRDLVPLCWRLVPAYARPEDEIRMQGAADRLEAEHGVRMRRYTIPRPTDTLLTAAAGS